MHRADATDEEPAERLLSRVHAGSVTLARNCGEGGVLTEVDDNW